MHPSGLVRLPIFWEDDDYFSCSPDWDIGTLGLDRPGVKCFDFHPIHLYLNTYSPDQYRHAKQNRFSSESLKEAEYNGSDKGIRSLFSKLCDYIKDNNIEVLTVGEVCSWA